MTKSLSKKIICIISTIAIPLAIFIMVSINSHAEDYSEVVGEFYIFSSPIAVDSTFGHAWIGILNTSNEPLQIGTFTLNPGEFYTLGRFMNSDNSSASGIYVNYERYRQSYEYNFRTNSFAHAPFKRIDLIQLNNFLANINPNTYNVVTNNCCHFAIVAWNSCMSEYYTYTYTNNPTTLCNYIIASEQTGQVFGGLDYVLPSSSSYFHY